MKRKGITSLFKSLLPFFICSISKKPFHSQIVPNSQIVQFQRGQSDRNSPKKFCELLNHGTELSADYTEQKCIF